MNLMPIQTNGWKRMAVWSTLVFLIWATPGSPQQARTGSSNSSSFGSGGSGSSGLSGGSFGSGSLSSGFSLGGSIGSSSGLGGSSSLGGSQSSSPFIPRNTPTGTSSRTGTTGVATSNIFSAYYANPFTAGMTNSTGKTFGAPLYTITATTGLLGGATATLGTSSTFGPSGTNPSYFGRRSPTYITVLGFDPPETLPNELQAKLQQVVARSSKLPSSPTIRVVFDGNIVVLRGMVANDRERRMAENIIRLSPGVRHVRNELMLRLDGPAPTAAR